MLTEQFRVRMGHAPSPSEQRSWERSLVVLAEDLHAAGLGSVDALVEYQLPLSSMRADVVLCGRNPRTRAHSYVVVELKQWTAATPVDGTADVCLGGGGGGLRLHPAEQVRRYCTYIADYLASLGGSPEELAGVAYLHNAVDQGVAGLWELEEDRLGRLFTGQRRGELHDHLRSLIDPESGPEAADDLLASAVRPSKQLLALAANEVQQREQFVLLDQQRTAYSMVMRGLERARTANRKQVVVVTGGPGSGKSAIALSLMGELSRQGRSVLHATGSSAFTKVLRKVAGARQPRIQAMFKYYNQFIDAQPNGIEVLINDEAHRLRETSTNRWTPSRTRTGRPQVEELIDAARVSVFLLDEHQVVRTGERGTVEWIRSAASSMGCELVQIDLAAQFRCGGSSAYEAWVRRLLGLESGGPTSWVGDDNFDVSVASAPSAMEARLATLLNRGYSARIAAGYCWEWSSPSGSELKADVRIGDWSRPWNNPKDTKIGDAPGRPYWALDPAGFHQVGCIYTAQGFEYDYSGVIIGPDPTSCGAPIVGSHEPSSVTTTKFARPKHTSLTGRFGTRTRCSSPEECGARRSTRPIVKPRPSSCAWSRSDAHVPSLCRDARPSGELEVEGHLGEGTVDWVVGQES